MSAKSMVVAARLIRGSGTPPEKFFRAGTKERLFSIGQNAAWHVIAPGVEPVHAFIYFDGQDLWAFGVGSGAPLELDGQTLGETWTQLVPPAVLTLGEAQIAFETVTFAPAHGRAEEERRAAARVDRQEATIVAQLPLAMFGSPASVQPSDPPATSAESAMEPDDLAATLERKSRRSKNRRRLVAGVLVFAALGFLGFRIATHQVRLPFWQQGATAVRAKKGTPVKPSASTSAAPAGSTAPAVGDAATAGSPAAASAPASPGPLEECMSGDAGDDDSTDNDVTLERRAANALVLGDEAVALRCYAELARNHPDQPVFREAARILREKKRAVGL
jgi:hypothetical protein